MDGDMAVVIGKQCAFSLRQLCYVDISVFNLCFF